MRTFSIILPIILTLSSCNFQKKSNTYYIDNNGKDSNDGSKNYPWRSILRLNKIDLRPGDSVFFTGGQTFYGTIDLDASDSGDQMEKVVLTSQGVAKAIIVPYQKASIMVDSAMFISIQNLLLKGSGRNDDSSINGLWIMNSSEITADSIEAMGFQRGGIGIFSSTNITITNCHGHENGFAGIAVTGAKNNKCRNIFISNCLAENNPGDPTAKDNHSGNGIITGYAEVVKIQKCVATNNGWDMPRTGNGPVGIWAYESDSVMIEHCISYKNKTSVGGEDGGGFDLDGGVTNSVIQYCLSYYNQGSGFGLFQFAGASTWKNNTIRFNISINDGWVSSGQSSIHVWNASDTNLSDCFFYNNVIVNEKAVALRFAANSGHKNFYFYNNVFVSHKNLLQGVADVSDRFVGNNWWCPTVKFVVNGVGSDFAAWAQATGHEILNKKIVGYNVDPQFGIDKDLITDCDKLPLFNSFKTPKQSPLFNAGLDLKALFNIEPGCCDFTGDSIKKMGIGADF